MGRPTKHGLDYFYVVCDPEDKIEYLEAKHGIVGFGTLVKLWRRIYKQHGYWCEWNEKSELVFSKEIGIEISTLKQIVDTCLEENIFSKEMLKKHGILTSSGVQKHFLSVCERAKRKNFEILPIYSLSIKTPEETRLTPELSTGNASLPQNNPEESTQSKVKYSKVNTNTGNTIVLPPGGVEEKNKDEIVGVVEVNKISGIASKSKSSLKKKVAPKKKGKNPDSEPFMKIHRTTWLKFNQTHRRITPDMDDQDYHWLKEIAAVLRERAIGNAVMWTQENATARLEKFFSTAYCKSKWLKDHFRLANLYQQRNDIFQIIENPNGQSGNKVSAGASSTHGRTIEFDRP